MSTTIFICSCNETVPATSTEMSTNENATPVIQPAEKQTLTESPMPTGTPDPDFTVDIYDPAKSFKGYTIFADNYDPGRPRIIEVNMKGEVTWQYWPGRGFYTAERYRYPGQ